MADVLSKVNQVRGVLPRDAHDPIVVKQTGQGYRADVSVVQFEGR